MAVLAQGAPGQRAVLLLAELTAPGKPGSTQALAIERAQDKERTNSGAQLISITEHYDTISDTTGLLHCSYQQIQVQGQP